MSKYPVKSIELYKSLRQNAGNRETIELKKTMPKLKAVSFLAGIIIVVILTALPACTSGPASPAPTPKPDPPPAQTSTYQSLATAGKSLFTAKCAVCHGKNGQGGVGPPLWGSKANLGRNKRSGYAGFHVCQDAVE